jgi:hypothetical protein
VLFVGFGLLLACCPLSDGPFLFLLLSTQYLVIKGYKFIIHPNGGERGVKVGDLEHKHLPELSVV